MVIRDKSLKKNKESILSFLSEWIVVEEKTRAGIHCLIKCNTVVTPVTVAMFCAPLRSLRKESLIPWKELDECNSDNDFRHKLCAPCALFKFISNPRSYQPNANDQYLLNAVARLLEEEDRHLGFAGHNNIGQKPRPVIQTHQNAAASNGGGGAGGAFNFSFGGSDLRSGGGHNNNRQQHHKQQQQQHHQHHGGGGGNKHQHSNSNNNNNNNNNANRKAEAKQRFFVVHAASVEAVQQAADSQDGWNWQPKLTKLLRKSPNLNMTLFFHISQSKCFYGAGRLTMVANRAHLNLFSRSTVSFEALSTFEKSYLRGRVLEEYLDGEELSPQSGRELMEFFK